MSSLQNVTIELPERMYTQLQQRANLAKRTVEAELLQLVSSVMPMAGELTEDLTEQLSQLQYVDDKTLWQAARSHLSKRALAQLQSLNYKRQREGLTETEAFRSNELLKQYERIILIRSQAIYLLKERGQDISEFNTEK